MTSRLRLFRLAAGLVAALALAACAAPSAPSISPTAPASSASTQPAAVSTSAAPNLTNDLTRTDVQGSVEFAVTPLNLEAPGASLDFMIVMNTHSVDLAWDLAAQSTLRTDTGLEVTGSNWPVGSGHHYEGTLTFPGQTAAGQALLAGAKSLTLTIRDTDVPERVFVWSLGQ